VPDPYTHHNHPARECQTHDLTPPGAGADRWWRTPVGAYGHTSPRRQTSEVSENFGSLIGYVLANAGG